MNYSWMAYEHGLQLLRQSIPSEHSAYTTVDSLQSRLLQNIAQAQNGDSDDLYINRKSLVEELNNCSNQIVRESFIELCISTSQVLEYLTCVYKAAQQACKLFSRGDIWADQCQNVIEQFQTRHEPDSIMTDIEDITVELYYINQCVTDLIELIEDFKAYCQPNRKSTDRFRDRQAEILHKLKIFIQEVLRIDNTFFEGLISWDWEATLSNHKKQSPTDQSYQLASYPFSEDSIKDDTYSSTALVDITNAEKKKQSFTQKAEMAQSEDPYDGKINQTALRKAVLRNFRRRADLRALCADVTQALRDQGIMDVWITLDALDGRTLPEQVLSLIEELDQRGYLFCLPLAARKSRPHFNY